jgi:beta-glucosidase
VDLALVERVGQALGVESAIEDVAVILGPGINIKRSPLCGRNFEYFSEDPIVSGAFGAALVTGIQSQGVGSSLKHFAANNQEHDRMRVSSDVDARPLREIYLRGFERVVRDAQPWTVMCAYNKINGVYASEDPWLLTQVLRDDWGFEGLVVSDWGAVNDRVVGLPAGLDLEMPSSGGRTDAQLVAAVQDGTLDEQALDAAANRVLDLVTKAQARPAPTGPLDVDAHHALAREAAGRAIVLLRNEGAILPLRRDAKLAVIGEFARTPRYQGAGSSLINPTRLDTALDELRALSAGEVVFAPGFALEGVAETRTARPRSSSPKPWPRHPPPTSQCCSSAFPPPTSRRVRSRPHRPARGAARAAGGGARSEPERRRRARTARSSRCPSVTMCPRSSRRGCSVRPAAARWPTCCSAS